MLLVNIEAGEKECMAGVPKCTANCVLMVFSLSGDGSGWKRVGSGYRKGRNIASPRNSPTCAAQVVCNQQRPLSRRVSEQQRVCS